MLRELEIIESGKLALKLESIDCMEMLRKAAALFAPVAMEKEYCAHRRTRCFPRSQ